MDFADFKTKISREKAQKAREVSKKSKGKNEVSEAGSV